MIKKIIGNMVSERYKKEPQKKPKEISKNLQKKRRKKSGYERLINALLAILFIVFLILTLGTVFYYLVVPTPKEWPGVFPFNTADASSNLNFTLPNDLWKPFIRHLALFPEHFTNLRRIEIVNYAFLTTFVYKIKRDVAEAFEEKKGKVPTAVYIEWAMGALLSGIIFSASKVGDLSIGLEYSVLYLVMIGSFSALSYLLYLLRRKLKEDESEWEKWNE